MAGFEAPGDSAADEQIMLLTVKEDNTFTLADTIRTVEGTGVLSGPAWKWTYFKGRYTHKSGVVIADENFMADDSVITARKRVSAPDGTLIMHMDMSLKAITPTTFETLAAALLKK